MGLWTIQEEGVTGMNPKKDLQKLEIFSNLLMLDKFWTQTYYNVQQLSDLCIYRVHSKYERAGKV